MDRRSLLTRMTGASMMGWSLPIWAQNTHLPPVPWFEEGRPTPSFRQCVGILEAAPSQGLHADDYQADEWRVVLTSLETKQALTSTEAAPIAAALTDTFGRYLHDLHFGRVDPKQLHQNFDTPRTDHFDAIEALQTAVQAGHLDRAVQQAVPQVPLYEGLRLALTRYHAMDNSPWDHPLPALPGGPGARAKLTPGQAYGGLAELQRRLQILGDMPAQAPAVTTDGKYGGSWVEAVKSFQERHGLENDGVIGAGTWAALQVPPRDRVHQIVLTLERLRWTPLLAGSRVIAINLPEFVLRGYEVKNGQIEVKTEMKVIVGQALDKKTPVFDEDMRSVEFSPYWNIPSSIARSETLPHLRRDPGYLARENMEFVAADGSVHRDVSAANLAAVQAGQMRIRQRPGAHNALGDIKFVFPNRDNIYLHHTPATQLFSRDRRDFSHGCIRVEKPVALAEFVLQDMPEWTEERIREAMNKGTPTVVKLAQPLPVLIAYGTALVQKNRVFFFPDLYGHDRTLEAALKSRPRVRVKLPVEPSAAAT
jgi:L,D-transpeptidase YcbB